jgi:F-type H+-transporting ATPase subunit epsilon
MSIAVKIVTPNTTAYDSTATEVQFPGFLGQMGVLEGHAQLLTLSKPGVITILSDRGTERYLVGKGFAELNATSLSLLVDLFETVDSIDKDKARSALVEAEDELSRTAPADESYPFVVDRVELARARVEA